MANVSIKNAFERNWHHTVAKIIENSNIIRSEMNTINDNLSKEIDELKEGSDQLILLSPNGTRFSITIGDDGILSANEITE